MLCLGCSAISLLGCSTISLDEPLDRAALDRVLRDRGIDPRRVVMPYALREDMRRWAEETVAGRAVSEEKLLALSLRLLDPDELPIEYVWGYTGTAQEVLQDIHC